MWSFVLLLVLCAIEGTHYSNQHSGACSRRPGCCQCVLPWPYVRKATAFASRGGLASRRALGEWQTHYCVLEGKSLFRRLPCKRCRPRSNATHKEEDHLLVDEASAEHGGVLLMTTLAPMTRTAVTPVT